MRASGCLPSFAASLGLHQHHRGGAIIDARGIGRGHRAVLGEGRTQLGDRVERGAVPADIRRVDHDVALAGLDRHRRDLVLEPAGLLRGLGLVLRADRELVLLLRG